MMSKSELLREVKSANFNYDRAKKSGMGVRMAQDRLFNVLFNCREDLIGFVENSEEYATDKLAELEAKIEKLEADKASLLQALDEADEENAKLRATAGRKKATKVENTTN